MHIVLQWISFLTKNGHVHKDIWSLNLMIKMMMIKMMMMMIVLDMDSEMFG